jgi:hypothetical protein
MKQGFPKLPVLLTALFLFVTGWGGLLIILLTTLPTLGPRWLFYFFLFLGLVGFILPIVDFFNRRFPSKPPAGAEIIIRQSVWFGIYGCLVTWLQFGRILNSGLVIFLAIGLVVIEFILRMNERSRFEAAMQSND